jgi:hypothetical protein
MDDREHLRRLEMAWEAEGWASGRRDKDVCVAAGATRDSKCAVFIRGLWLMTGRGSRVLDVVSQAGTIRDGTGPGQGAGARPQ